MASRNIFFLEAKSVTEIGKPGVVFQPSTYQGLQKGIDQLIKAIKPTLGPRPKTVVLERAFRDKMPEFLDDGGMIARRIIQIQNRDADVGAMFLRQVLWNVREYVGDGTATTAVLFGSIFQQGLHYITAGGNAMQLQHYLEIGLRVILSELDTMSRQIIGKQNLTHIARTICYDPELAGILGEIMDNVGEYGGVDLGTNYSRGFRKEYIEGSFWPNSIIGSNYTNEPGSTQKILNEPAILISDLDVEDPQILIPLVESCIRAGERKLVLIAANYSESAIGLINAVNKDPEKFQLLAVTTPGMASNDQAYHMEDIAVLTSGVPRIKAAGDSLEYIKTDHLGHARQAFANKEYFGIIHGKGDPITRRSHISHLKKAYSNSKDNEERKRFQKRLAKFWNGSAALYIGGVNETETNQRKEMAERTIDALRGALREGVLPGGGVALLACRSALKTRISVDSEPEEYAAYRILIKAMEVPIRTLLINGGYDDSEVMAELKLSPPGSGFDVNSGKIVSVTEAGILDVAAVVKAAVRAAVSGAGLALTIDVIVHHKNPEESMNP